MKGDWTRPVPVALTFGLHAILTSIFVLQGNGDLSRIATYTKQSYNTLFTQLDQLSDPQSPPQNAPNFYSNVEMFHNLVNFAKPAISSDYDHGLAIDPAFAEKISFWNPLIGGEYMLYGTYMCSVGLGSATVDSLGQLRFTLHMYNALKERDPSLSNTSFLNDIDQVFARTTTVWVAGRPQKGSYCKHFWMAWGMSAAHAGQMASEKHASYLKNRGKQDSENLR
jgi:hypothetical protein